jgi:hypothetical protein
VYRSGQRNAFGGRGLDRGYQRRMEWDGRLGAGLFLNNPDQSVREFRSAHFDTFASPLAGL